MSILLRLRAVRLQVLAFAFILVAALLLWLTAGGSDWSWRIVISVILAAAAGAIISALPTSTPTQASDVASPPPQQGGSAQTDTPDHDDPTLEAIFQASDYVAFVVIDNDTGPGRILDISPAAERMFGYTRAEAIGMSIGDIHLPEDGAQLPDVLRDMRDGGDGFAGQATLVRKSGELFQARFSIRPVHGAGGVRPLAVHSAIDIGERQQMEEELYKANETLRAIIGATPLPIFALDLDGKVQLLWNPAAERATGWRASEIIGRDLPLDDGAPANHLATVRNLLSGSGKEQAAGREVSWRHRDGNLTHYNVYSSALRDARGAIYGTLAIMVDITQRRRAEEALRRANDQLQRSLALLEQRSQQERILSEMSDMLHSCLSPEEAYSIVARSGAASLPDQPGALYVQTSSEGQLELAAAWGGEIEHEPVFPSSECWALRRYRTHIVTETDPSLHCPLASRVGRLDYVCVPLVALGETIGVLHVRLTHDATPAASAQSDGPLANSGAQLVQTMAERIGLALANIRLRVKLREQAIRDPLTGVHNRRYMEETLERELRRAKRRGAKVAVMMLDIDRFKLFNDTHGHEAGNAALIALGTFLRSRVRGEDVVCRYGGEEFTLILPDITIDVAARRAEQICAGFAGLPIEHLGRVVGNVTVSIGLAMFPDDADTADSVLHRADEALYQAKAAGRNRVVVFAAPKAADIDPAPEPQQTAG